MIAEKKESEPTREISLIKAPKKKRFFGAKVNSCPYLGLKRIQKKNQKRNDDKNHCFLQLNEETYDCSCVEIK